MKIAFLLITIISQMAFAKGPQYLSNTISEAGYSGRNNVYASIIPYGGGVGFSGAYELMKTDSFGYGVGVTVLPKKEDSNYQLAGLTAIGGNVRFHFPIEFFDFYASPGLNLMIMKIPGNTEWKDETTLGASFALGALAQINHAFALGIESTFFHPWFNKESYLSSRVYFFNTAITARVSF
ncbi:MAG: outer membrane beta-barrel protein [Bdellovibrionaceae bacterium]|nr:outer membrane beta-barrel protein [Pseudobdellovibrionaceae bacterium]